MKLEKMKAYSLLFILFMVITLVIAGCSNDEEAGDTTNNGDGSGEQTDNGAGEDTNDSPDPAEVEYPDSLTYWSSLDGNVAVTSKTLNDVAAYQELESITGTKVEFKHPSGEGSDVTEQFNLMLASGNLPDVIEYGWLNVSKGPDNAIKDGTILRLNELIEDYAPNFRSYLDENPDIEKMIMTDEGNIYGFPFLRGHEKLMVFKGPLVRQDWLDKLNLEIPTTIDEWEEVLVAIKEGDPNGNGEADEIPLLLELGDIKSLGAFASAWGTAPWFYNDNGTVKFGSIEPEFEEFLTTMSDWFERGLLDPDFNVIDTKLRDAKVTSEQLGALYSYTGSGIGKYTGLMEEENPDFELVSAPHPSVEPGGKAALGQMDHPFPGTPLAAISGSAENPEQIAKWLDFGYSEEGHMLFNFGIEGESYEMIDGYPTYTDEIMNNPDGLPVTQAMGKYFRSSYSGIMVQDERYIEQYAELPSQQEAIEKWAESAENEIKMPPVTLTAEENEEYASIMSDLETYYDEMVVRFIMAEEPVDGGFEDFVATLKGMGIERAVELQQQALDRYNQR